MMRRVNQWATSSIPATSKRELPEPASPDAIALLRAHPALPQAIRLSLNGLVTLYQGSHLLNWLMDDRARLLFGYLSLYFDAIRDADDPTSGLTPTRMKAVCVEQQICSPGRATAMLSLMRFAGYLAPDAAVADRRHRPLVPTQKLIDLLRTRWRLHFAAMAPLFADGEAMLAAVDDPALLKPFVTAMGERFLAGFRVATHAPSLGLFSERNGGMMIFASLMTAGGEDDTMPPTRPVPISISALARRFAVSRTHVLKLIQDAEADGTIRRQGDRIVITPQFADATRTFFATMYLFFADCARETMRASRPISR